MKAKFIGALVLALLLLLVFAMTASAVSQSTIDSILQDAKDGQIDGTWTAAEIRAALAYAENNPTLDQYTQIKGALEDYLASLQAPGSQSGELAFTGGEIFLVFAAGAGLIVSGALLRRRRA
jgi:hypothetical protein